MGRSSSSGRSWFTGTLALPISFLGETLRSPFVHKVAVPTVVAGHSNSRDRRLTAKPDQAFQAGPRYRAFAGLPKRVQSQNGYQDERDNPPTPTRQRDRFDIPAHRQPYGTRRHLHGDATGNLGCWGTWTRPGPSSCNIAESTHTIRHVVHTDRQPPNSVILSPTPEAVALGSRPLPRGERPDRRAAFAST